MLDLRDLRSFVAVTESENVGRAAKTLNMTQSPLSRQIIALEERLGVVLFLRVRKRLQLTSAGRDFLGEARALLEHSESLKRHVRALSKGLLGSIRLGYVDGAMHSGVLGAGLRAVRRHSPNVDVEIKLLRSAEQVRQIQDGRLDIGLTYSKPPDSALVQSRLIHEEGFKLAAPVHRGWMRRRSAKELDGEVFVALPVSDYTVAREVLVDACARAGFRPDIRYEAAAPLAVMDMVDAGLGLALVQDSLERIKPEGVSIVPLPTAFDYTLKVYVVHRDPSPIVETFLSAF